MGHFSSKKWVNFQQKQQVPFIREVVTLPLGDIIAPAVKNIAITITGNIPNATALTSGLTTGTVQSNGDFIITLTVPNGTSTVMLTAIHEEQTSTLDINISAIFSTLMGQ
ncbi:MAG: hypothetical protein L3J10_10085 [Sulfurimonas sp.]|nr:hypothetical protein [Sulfurimonas sp.]